MLIVQSSSSLVPFDDCVAVLNDLKAQALARVGPYGLGLGGTVFLESGTFAQLGQRSFLVGLAKSATNTQEPGIDEPDLVETDGHRVFDVRGGTLRVVDAMTAKLTDTLALGLVNVDGAVLVGDVLVVFANEPLSNGRQAGDAKVVLVDVSARPVIGQRLTIDGNLVDVRVVDGRVHLVTVSAPSIAFTYPTEGGDQAVAAATEANKERIRSSTLGDWLPTRTVTGGGGRAEVDHAQLTACNQIRRPKTFAGFEQTSLVTLDLGDLAASPSTSVQAASLLVYGSADNLYTATTSYDDLNVTDGVTRGKIASGVPHTDIHRFSLGAVPAYAGSGRVDGYVRDQFGLSEYDGHLRVASTGFALGAGTSSRVTVLRLGAGELVQTGVLDGLGANENIEGVRFVGDLGYLVTFRRTDPLHVLDLRDPAAPRLAGELSVPGYSAYLHPVGDGLLLGVGYDGTTAGRLTGAAASLVDVRDPGAPRRVDLQTFGSASAPKAEADHHAFTWWAETGTAYIPVAVFAEGARVEVVRVKDGRLTTVGVIVPSGQGAPTSTEFDRVIVVGNRLLSVSPDGVQVSNAATLAPIAWVSFG